MAYDMTPYSMYTIVGSPESPAPGPAPVHYKPTPPPVQYQVVPTPPSRPYASDDQLFWPPPSNIPCGCIIPKYESPIPLARARRSSVPDLTRLALMPPSAQNIDKSPPLQTLTVASVGATNQGNGFFVNTMDQRANMFSGRPPSMAALPPYMGLTRPRKPVNMNRALGFALVATCLCPPLGLAGLGTALSGRRHRYKNRERAMFLRRTSYVFSILVGVIIIMGIIVIVLLSQKYRYF